MLSSLELNVFGCGCVKYLMTQNTAGIQNAQLVQLLANILKKINPHKHKVRYLLRIYMHYSPLLPGEGSDLPVPEGGEVSQGLLGGVSCAPSCALWSMALYGLLYTGLQL